MIGQWIKSMKQFIHKMKQIGTISLKKPFPVLID